MRLLCSADSIPGSMVVPFVLIRLLSVDLVEVRSLGKHGCPLDSRCTNADLLSQVVASVEVEVAEEDTADEVVEEGMPFSLIYERSKANEHERYGGGREGG
jgi:hypothetical protein